MPAFLFSDIKDSTLSWQASPEAMAQALALHDQTIRRSLQRHEGREVKHTGDGFMAVFDGPAALSCALEIQRGIRSLELPRDLDLQVRIGIHVGDAYLRDGDYFGAEVSRTARIMDAGRGGQIVVSASAAESQDLPDGTRLLDCGQQFLKDLLAPIRLYLLEFDGGSSSEGLRSVSAAVQNLPVQPGAFLGREREISDIRHRLRSDSECRLLSIIGMGGVGKTRLALQAGVELLERFPDGVFFVPLEDVHSRNGLVAAISGATGIAAAGSSPLEDLCRKLSYRRALLLLDNFEHLVRMADLIETLVARTERPVVVVTSRERLGLRREWSFRLAGLEEDDADAAEELFLQRALMRSSAFDPEEASRTAVAKICESVEGVPLAIELAASWVEVMDCEQIAGEISRGLQILAAEAPDLAPRQRSLKAVLDHSWQLLSPESRSLMSKMAVFQGSFRLGDAQAVAGAGPAEIRELTSKSLLEPAGQGWIRVNGLVSRYCLNRLADLELDYDQILLAHCRHFAAVSDFDVNQQSDMELALSTAVSESLWLEAGRLCSELVQTYTLHSLFLQGLQVFDSATTIMDCSGNDLQEAKVRSMLLAARGSMLARLGRYEMARSDLEEALAGLKSGDDEGWWHQRASATLGRVLFREGRAQEAEAIWREALAEAEERGAEPYSLLFSNLGSAAQLTGRHERAEMLYRRAMDSAESAGDSYAQGRILYNLGTLVFRLGRREEGESMVTRGLGIQRDLGDRQAIAQSLTWLGGKRMERDRQGAMELFEKASRIQKRIGDDEGLFRSMVSIAAGKLEEEAPREAIRGYREAYRLAESMGLKRGKCFAREHLGLAQLQFGEMELAIRSLASACEMARALDNSLCKARTKIRLALALVLKGKTRRASKLAAEATAKLPELHLEFMLDEFLLTLGACLYEGADAQLAATCLDWVRTSRSGKNWTIRRAEELLENLDPAFSAGRKPGGDGIALALRAAAALRSKGGWENEGR